MSETGSYGCSLEKTARTECPKWTPVIGRGRSVPFRPRLLGRKICTRKRRSGCKSVRTARARSNCCKARDCPALFASDGCRRRKGTREWLVCRIHGQAHLPSADRLAEPHVRPQKFSKMRLRLDQRGPGLRQLRGSNPPTAAQKKRQSCPPNLASSQPRRIASGLTSGLRG